MVGNPKLPGNAAPTQGDGIEVAASRVAPWEGFDSYQQLVGGPAVYLSVSGRGLAEAKGIRTVVKEAKDDAGNLLKRGGNPPKREFNGPGFGEQDDGIKFLKLRLVSGDGEKKGHLEQKLSRCAPGQIQRPLTVVRLPLVPVLLGDVDLPAGHHPALDGVGTLVERLAHLELRPVLGAAVDDQVGGLGALRNGGGDREGGAKGEDDQELLPVGVSRGYPGVAVADNRGLRPRYGTSGCPSGVNEVAVRVSVTRSRPGTV